MTFSVTILTLFPEMFPGILGCSVVGRALKAGIWALDVVNIRDFAEDKHRTVDDIPYGGGAGMVMKPDVVAAAIRAVRAKVGPCHVVYLAPHGRRFVQAHARQMAENAVPLVVLCGHYEGIDERVLEAEVDAVVSLGDFVLSGGEPAAMVMLDAVIRLLPGVLGGDASLHEESFDLVDADGTPLVEYPHYTRPALWEGREVPAVLQSGHHGEIRKWRLSRARERTLALGRQELGVRNQESD